jgi:hypothetical protein
VLLNRPKKSENTTTNKQNRSKASGTAREISVDKRERTRVKTALSSQPTYHLTAFLAQKWLITTDKIRSFMVGRDTRECDGRTFTNQLADYSTYLSNQLTNVCKSSQSQAAMAVVPDGKEKGRSNLVSNGCGLIYSPAHNSTSAVYTQTYAQAHRAQARPTSTNVRHTDTSDGEQS